MKGDESVVHVVISQVREEVKLPKEMRGIDLMNLVRELILPETYYAQEMLHTEVIPPLLHVVGRRGAYTHSFDLAICVGEALDELGINMEGTYTKIAVVAFTWKGGPLQTVPPPVETQEHVVKTFAKMLSRNLPAA